MNDYYVSAAGKEKLYQERQEVQKEISAVQSELGECAQTDSHLDENPTFQDLRVKLMYELPRKLNELTDKLNNAKIIEQTPEYLSFDGQTVIMGSEVTFSMEGREQTFKILGYGEGDFKKRKMSCDAPIAAAMLGHKVGEQVYFNNKAIDIIAVKII